MKLKTVTVTGADDSVAPGDLVALTRRFPFVEWGILLSRRNMGTPRYPSSGWIKSLVKTPGSHELTLSGHLCGKWVRELAGGYNRFVEENPYLAGVFDRIQLNFHGEPQDVDAKFSTHLMDWSGFGRRTHQFIFQFDGENESIFSNVFGVSVAPLFDLSGGAGIEPLAWPVNMYPYAGYAGGLHPDKLVDQLKKIEVVAGEGEIWIDVETHVRSADDKEFDLDKVRKFLSCAEPFVMGTAAAR